MGLRHLALSMLAVSLAVSWHACGPPDHETVAPMRDFIYRGESDPARLATYRRAQASLGEFRDALRNPQPTFNEFGVKVGFTDGQRVENLWVTNLRSVRTIHGEGFEGELATEPNALKNIRKGRRFVVMPGEIQDWMYWDGKKRIGGVTVRAAVSR